MKEINDFLLNLFTGNDDLRQTLTFPNLNDGIVSACDSNVLMMIPESELSFKYNTNERYPNTKSLIDAFEASKNIVSIKVKVSDIAKELVKARIEVDKDYIDCEECEGCGEVEWEYIDNHGNRHEKSDECPICKGDGSSEVVPKFARVKLCMIEDKEGRQFGIEIGDLYFHPFQLYRLFMVAVLKGYDQIEIHYNNKNQTVTYFGNIKVFVMGMIKIDAVIEI